MISELQDELLRCSDQLIACAALMLAVVILYRLPSLARSVVFITLFATGLLAAAASAAQQAVASLGG